ncbi:hypothetical protein [Paenibacillus sp. 1P07SE]|uniref:hypothetical protein n=1 Tax=Paenibacillus sp. 1P07SE TaxID=3132209 RepID=UPI0039A42D0B
MMNQAPPTNNNNPQGGGENPVEPRKKHWIVLSAIVGSVFIILLVMGISLDWFSNSNINEPPAGQSGPGIEQPDPPAIHDSTLDKLQE